MSPVYNCSCMKHPDVTDFRYGGSLLIFTLPSNQSKLPCKQMQWQVRACIFNNWKREFLLEQFFFLTVTHSKLYLLKFLLLHYCFLIWLIQNIRASSILQNLDKRFLWSQGLNSFRLIAANWPEKNPAWQITKLVSNVGNLRLQGVHCTSECLCLWGHRNEIPFPPK